MTVQAGSEVHFSKHLLASSRSWEPWGKRTCKKQTQKPNHLETAPKSCQLLKQSENVQIQDQAFERIQKTTDTRT